jgi:3-hydroxyisobutyrate dehydrogenase-like beta-hydroxyacid dehydrogenase
MQSTLNSIGIVSPGDMGHAVGQVLAAHGLDVITSLTGRSARTRGLAGKAGIRDVGSLENLASKAQVILSILVPAEAVNMAQAMARAMAHSTSDVLYIDCNAIAPQTAHVIEEIITSAGGRFVDASIIGGPPRLPRREGARTTFYASGLHAEDFALLRDYGLDVITLGDQAGQASALKMCYAALTKGFTALCTELLTAAAALGVSAQLADEFRLSQPVFFEQMNRSLPGMPTKARRWVGEMEEISQTFAALGLTPKILAGAADIYRLVGETVLANRTPEDPAPPPTVAEVAAVLAEAAKTHNT